LSELNKQKARMFVEAVLNEGRVELIDELVAVDYVGDIRCPEQTVIGRAELRRLVMDHRRTYPDLYVKIEDEIAERDLVVLRWRATATTPETGATGDRLCCWTGISVIRLLAGRQVDTYTAVAPGVTAVLP
jgi:predicted SnoaL-like aldol condensation-catalyzing enzyme